MTESTLLAADRLELLVDWLEGLGRLHDVTEGARDGAVSLVREAQAALRKRPDARPPGDSYDGG